MEIFLCKMEEDAYIRILVELIDYENVTQARKIIARNRSIPSYVLSEDFNNTIGYITRWRYHIVVYRWGSYFDDCYKKMLTSHEMYLIFVMFACITEQKHHQNVFDGFLSVCMLVKYLNDDIFYKTMVDLRHLRPDIVMVYYQNELKSLFSELGGFQKLMEYIRSSRVSRKKCNKKKSLEMDVKFREEYDSVMKVKADPEKISNDMKSAYLANLVLINPSISLPSLPIYEDLVMTLVAHRKHAPKIMDEKFEIDTTDSISTYKCIKWNRKRNTLIFPDMTDPVSKELHLSKEGVENMDNNLTFQEFINEIKIPMEANALYSNQTTLSSTSVSTPSLLNEFNPIVGKVVSKKKEIVKTVEEDGKSKETLTSETSNAASSLNPDSESNYDPKYQENIESYENIVQAVIRYNNSKNLSDKNPNNRIQKEADGVLEHLKGSIEYLIEVLVKCDSK